MNLTQLVARCKTRFRDTGGLTVTEDEWKAYINDAYAEVLAARPDWPFMEHTSTALTVAAGTGSVDLPDDAWRVTAVYNATDRYPMTQLDGRDEHLWQFPVPSEMLGAPQIYRLHNKQLHVYPYPVHTTQLVVEYIGPVAELTDNDEPVFPEQYHRLLVSGALQLAYQDNGNLQQAAAHAKDKEQLIAAMAIDLFGPRATGYPQPVDSFFE